jgi:hypothetical protein
VGRQPTCPIAKLSTGVITAMPAIEPVERKNRAMPRRRVNQWLITGVSATGLVKASPTDSSRPNDSRKASVFAVVTVHHTAAMTSPLPVTNTGRVPKRAINRPASGIARP